MTDDQIVAVARIKLPLALRAISEANLEAQKNKPDLDKINEIMSSDDYMAAMDIDELLQARRTFQRHTSKEA